MSTFTLPPFWNAVLSADLLVIDGTTVSDGYRLESMDAFGHDGPDDEDYIFEADFCVESAGVTGSWLITFANMKNAELIHAGDGIWQVETSDGISVIQTMAAIPKHDSSLAMQDLMRVSRYELEELVRSIRDMMYGCDETGVVMAAQDFSDKDVVANIQHWLKRQGLVPDDLEAGTRAECPPVGSMDAEPLCHCCGGVIADGIGELCKTCAEGNDPFESAKYRSDFLP